MTDHVNPDVASLARDFSTRADEGPIVMLNLNRYRDRAHYEPAPPDGVDGDVSGRDAYLRYGIVAQQAVESVGGAILWATDAHDVVIGCDHDRYDEVVAVWYPSRAAFLRLAEFPGYVDALAHRTAAIEQATLLACRGDLEPALRNPFSS
jgi:hypothetical protein